MSKLRICVVAALMADDYRIMPCGDKAYGWEGTARLAHELATHLNRNDYRVAAITSQPLWSYSRSAYGYDLYPLQFSVKRLASFREVVERINPDIIHFHGGMQMAHFASIYNSTTRIPSVFTFTHPPASAKYSFNTALMQKLNPLILKLRRHSAMRKVLFPFNHIIVQTNFLKGALIHEGFLTNEISVIPYGVQERFLQKDKNIEPINFCFKDVVLFWGAATRRRGFHVFLKAAKIILKQRSNVGFVVATNRMDPVLRNMAKELSQRTDRFQLFDSSVEKCPFSIARIVQSAALVVLPFLGPTAIDPPLTLLESAALGKCVISSPVLSIPEVIGDGRGAIVMPVSNELANTILMLLDNASLRIEMGANAGSYIHERFNWSSTIGLLSELYQKILNSSNQPYVA